MSPVSVDDPQQAGDYWVIPSIDDSSSGSLRVSIAISVAAPEELTDADVQVDVTAGGSLLTATETPPTGALPAIQLVGTNQYAQFRFDNPGDPPPQSIDVTVRGGTTSFDLGVV